MAVVSMSYLLEAGVHFGHQTKRWNPKMKEYIFTSRDDIYIIDLEKTKACLEEAYAEIKTIAENGGKFLFVGTLTNFRTIRRRVKRLEEIEKMEADGTFELLPKKEVIGLKKEYEKLNRVLCGIRNMEKLPQAIIVVDPKKEINAIKEARKLRIPVFGIVDTNCDPDDVDYVIPGNDDAVRSIKVMLGVLTNAICEANGLELVDYVSEDDKKEDKETKKEKTEVKQEEIREEVKVDETVLEEIKEMEKVDELEAKTLSELKKLAKENKIKGYSTMKKDELIEMLSK